MLGMVRIYWLSDSAPQTPNKKTSIIMLVFFCLGHPTIALL